MGKLKDLMGNWVPPLSLSGRWRKFRGRDWLLGLARRVHWPHWLAEIRAHLRTWSEPPVPEAAEGRLVAHGTGGRLELEGNCLRLTKGGVFGFFLALFGIEGGFVERTIRVSDIAAVEMDKPALFFRYMRFSYPGSPDLTGNDFEDMMAENAILMSLFDNRPLFRIKERIEHAMNEQVHR